ncbi:peptidylprolyl isomerase [Chelativorans sp. AA-79]|uniref:peptidylprolyl isomerase n=1 Tax=Chelativorans sp. AA-79 TaxID=3028735 RepID=UPI0023F6E25C|nr:peptidylprolyl isomerase [Chelativorans sp. AA-79]WEX11998.1 peptidylprolyl isomerase [Chelativorans sp. AA-79]
MMSACQAGGCGGGPAPRMQPPSFSQVWVNGVEITPEGIAREIQHHPAADPKTAWTEAVRALAIRELLLQEAERLGIEADPQPDEAGRVETDTDAVIEALLDKEVTPAVPDEDECHRFYAAQARKFRTPDLFEASHILIEPEGDDTEAWDEAEAQARAIIGEIGDDSAAFAEVARELSACPSAHQGGSLGQVRRGELLPDVENAIMALEEGRTRSEPVRSRYGWHVIRLARKIEGHVLPFELVKDKIAEMLEARSWSIAAARYIAGLAERAEVDGIAIEAMVEPGVT